MSDSPNPDEALMAQVAAGEHGVALGELIDRYGRRVYAVGMRTLNDNALAEDLVQETFTRLWRGAGRFDSGQGSVSAYVLTIARRAAIDLHRRRPAPAAELPVELTDDGTDAYERLLARLDLRAALATLPDHHRAVLEMTYDEDLSQQEIAGRLGIPTGTVKSRTHHALRALREQLKPDAEGPGSSWDTQKDEREVTL